MAQTFERKVISDGSPTLPQVPPWPRPVAYSVPADAQVLPVPGAHNFKYSRVFRLGPPDKPKVAVKRPAANAKPAAAQPFNGLFGPAPAARPAAYGHQLTGVRPPTNLSAPQMR